MANLCVIGARGGSSGLPGKNIKLLLGKPLIAWSIDQALNTPEINKVIVSTDSIEIANVAQSHGAEVPFIRPKNLSGPNVGKFQVWQHALNACEKHYDEDFDMFIDLDCTNPLRTPDDISKAIKQLRKGRKRHIDAVFSVCNARKNPYFNMVELKENGGGTKLNERFLRRPLKQNL